MIFADLQAGDAIFLDANTLIYHFTQRSHIWGGMYTVAATHRSNKRSEV